MTEIGNCGKSDKSCPYYRVKHHNEFGKIEWCGLKG